MITLVASETQTRLLGRRLGRLLSGADVVCLFGELGAGKTTLTQGLAAGMGYKGRVTSPTFGLAREYRGRRWSIYHLDLYRVGARQTGDIGIEEYLQDPRGVCVIEWPEAALAYYPKDRLEIRLQAIPGGRRRIFLRGLGLRSRGVVRRLKT